MARSLTNLQETFLNQCRKQATLCIVYLVNGVQLRGVIKGFDNFTLVLEEGDKQQMIYKHAVTTVQPVRRLPDVVETAYEALADAAAEESGPE